MQKSHLENRCQHSAGEYLLKDVEETDRIMYSLSVSVNQDYPSVGSIVTMDKKKLKTYKWWHRVLMVGQVSTFCNDQCKRDKVYYY